MTLDEPSVHRAATIYDVAREAGVSISTVSNALNRPHKVGEATRSKVMRAADELGYTPKAEAASLARRSVQRVGVFAPFSSYESFMRRLAGVLEVAGELGIEVSVFDHGSVARLESPVLESVPLQARFDGVMVMGMALDPVVEGRLRERGLPVVLVDAESASYPSLLIDDDGAGALVADHLLGLGHRRFGYVSEEQTTDYESQAARRLHGFRSRIDAIGGCTLEVREALPTVEASEAAGLELLSSPDRPTALVAHFDLMAAGLLRAARGLGLAVPQDVAVVGFDDGTLAEAADLTTVRQPFEDSGRVAMRMLNAAIAQEGPHLRTRLSVELIERGSTRRAAQ